MPGLLMKYFVIKPKGTDIYAKASRTAMHAYARIIKEENPKFSKELATWASIEGAEAEFAGEDK